MDKLISNNKHNKYMKLYTKEQVTNVWQKYWLTSDVSNELERLLEQEKSIEIPSDEEMEEKLNVAYGNGYEQGEMDFYKKMKGQGNEYADGYEEGYIRALELVKFQIVERLEKGGNND